MSRTKRTSQGLIAPTALPPFDPQDADPRSFTHVRHIHALSEAFEKALEDFFVNYHELGSTKDRVIGERRPSQARRRVEACRKAAHARAAG